MDKVTMIFWVVCLGLAPLTSYAMSDASKVGANAGAMRYCSENHASGGDKLRYSLLKRKTKEAYEALDSSDKTKALLMKKKGEEGEYLGKPLTEEKCDSLRKSLYLKYK